METSHINDGFSISTFDYRRDPEGIQQMTAWFDCQNACFAHKHVAAWGQNAPANAEWPYSLLQIFDDKLI